VQTNDLGFAIG